MIFPDKCIAIFLNKQLIFKKFCSPAKFCIEIGRYLPLNCRETQKVYKKRSNKNLIFTLFHKQNKLSSKELHLPSPLKTLLPY